MAPDTMTIFTRELFMATLPMLVVGFGALVALVQSFLPVALGGRRPVMGVAFATIIASIVALSVSDVSTSRTFLSGGVLAERLGAFGQATLLVIALVTLIKFSSTWLVDRFFRGESVSLFLMTLLGMMTLVAADDLVTVFVGLELSAIGLYAMIGYVFPTRRSVEAAVKYLVLGAFAAGFLLYGMALMYAACGSLRVSDLVTGLSANGSHPWMMVGGVFFMVGLSFKLALVPFHLWAPDAYEGAPTGVTSFMVTAVKVMVLVFLARLLARGLPDFNDVWMPAFGFLAVLSMIVGNVMALVQTNLKRMLAYSSIAHSGYMAVALCAIAMSTGRLPVDAVLFYVVAYSIMSLGAFGVIMWLEREDLDQVSLDHVAGLASRHRWASLALATFMFGFAGMPPTAGFIAKFFVFNAAIGGSLTWLVLIGALGSTISLGYYLRVIVKMYMRPVDTRFRAPEPKRSFAMTGVVAASLAFTLLLGTILPSVAIRLVHEITSQVAAN